MTVFPVNDTTLVRDTDRQVGGDGQVERWLETQTDRWAERRGDRRVERWLETQTGGVERLGYRQVAERDTHVE